MGNWPDSLKSQIKEKQANKHCFFVIAKPFPNEQEKKIELH